MMLKHKDFRTWVRRCCRDDRGAAMVEFALALPVLLIILLAVIEVGRVVYAHGAVNFAAQEATRFATVNFDASIDQLEDVAMERLIGIRKDRIVSLNVASDLDAADQTKLVTVQIQYRHALLLPVFRQEAFTLTGESKGFLVEK